MAWANTKREVVTEVDVDPYALAQSRAWASVDRLTLMGRASPRALRFGFGEPMTSFWDLPPVQHWPGKGGTELATGSAGRALPATSAPGSATQNLLGEFGL